MLYTREFDQARKEDKKFVERKAFQTAEKLNRRMQLFLEDLYKDRRLSLDKVRQVRKKMLENI